MQVIGKMTIDMENVSTQPPVIPNMKVTGKIILKMEKVQNTLPMVINIMQVSEKMVNEKDMAKNIMKMVVLIMRMAK